MEKSFYPTFLGAMHPYIYSCHRKLLLWLVVVSKKIQIQKSLIRGSDVLKLMKCVDMPLLPFILNVFSVCSLALQYYQILIKTKVY
jgi:hypothetical protein